MGSEMCIRDRSSKAAYKDDAQNLYGFYLRALHAETNKDVNSAAKFYTESLAIDKTNPKLLQASFSNLYASGQIIAAAELHSGQNLLTKICEWASSQQWLLLRETLTGKRFLL